MRTSTVSVPLRGYGLATGDQISILPYRPVSVPLRGYGLATVACRSTWFPRRKFQSPCGVMVLQHAGRKSSIGLISCFSPLAGLWSCNAKICTAANLDNPRFQSPCGVMVLQPLGVLKCYDYNGRVYGFSPLAGLWSCNLHGKNLHTLHRSNVSVPLRGYGLATVQTIA